MSGIPVLFVEGDCIARAWENALISLNTFGCDIKTQYDTPDSLPSKDSTMVIVVNDPLSEPMIHLDFPGGFEDLQEYVMEVCDGIKDHCIRDPNDPDDMRWEYTYHKRLFQYQVPTLAPIDQIENICRQLADTPHTRRAQAITWKVWEDMKVNDPACLQSIWCRINYEDGGVPVLNMNVRFRSNDAYKAAFMNIFALVQLQVKIANRIQELMDRNIKIGRYCHIADSFHIYGSNMLEFNGRFLKAINNRTFENRTMQYKDNAEEMMKSAIPNIISKAAKMVRTTTNFI
jgi:thymidylate synthase